MSRYCGEEWAASVGKLAVERQAERVRWHDLFRPCRSAAPGAKGFGVRSARSFAARTPLPHRPATRCRSAAPGAKIRSIAPGAALLQGLAEFGG